MANVFDVAKYVLKKLHGTTHMKLQKLVYYSQAWSLIWDETPLFESRIEAWANGPVSPELYAKLRGSFQVDENNLVLGNVEALTESEKETVEAVLKEYGDKGSQWLSDLTHLEKPWQESRQGLGPGDNGSQTITHASMAEYYGSL